MGPQALRVAGLTEALTQEGCSVIDRGDVQGPSNPRQAPHEGYRHLNEVVVWNQMVYAEVFSTLAAGHLPMLLGGDHCLAIGSLSAVAQHCRRAGKALKVIWLDAHADFNTVELSPSGNMHGMPLSILCGMGPDALTRLCGLPSPALSSENICQVGVRSVDPGERRLLHELDVKVFDMRYIDEHGMRTTMEFALQDITPQTHVHVSLDVDFLDPCIAPGVSTAVHGGPTYREAELCMEMLYDTHLLGSLDVMELNPACDIRNSTATLVVTLLRSLFGRSTLLRP